MSKPFKFSRQTLNVILALAVVAIAIAGYQTWHFAQVRTGQAALHSFCNVGQTFDCNAVDASRYAELFLGIPLSSAALGWWLAILLLSLLARSAEFAAPLAPALLGMTGIGAAFSVVYLGIMMAVLRVGCLLCLGMDAVNFAAFALLLKSWWGKGRFSNSGFSLGTPAIAAGICLLVSILFARGMTEGAPSSSDIQQRVNEVLGSTSLTLNLPPELPSLGNANAPITIVKFSDFQCPSCRVGAQSLHPVLKGAGSQVRFVFRNFPLDMKCNRLIQRPMHPASCELARGAICANQQGKFEAYYLATFEDQPMLREGSALEIARKSGLDTTTFEACLDKQETRDQLARDIEEGISLKVESTPTFFINGRRQSGALPPQGWNLILEALSQRKD